MDCLNCDGTMPPRIRPGSLFCSEICKQRADTVRYGRRVYRDGRINDPLVAEALRTKMAFAVTDGGYPGAVRELDPATRQAVIDRDGGKCVLCGQTGTEIDHIANSSPELSNLQLLCHECHTKKTQRNLQPIEPGSQADKTWSELMMRIRSPEPLRACDDEVGWPVEWRKIAAERRLADVGNAVT
jgi:5-methylcytosine-specific restriction endonuclease McrA